MLSVEEKSVLCHSLFNPLFITFCYQLAFASLLKGELGERSLLT